MHTSNTPLLHIHNATVLKKQQAVLDHVSLTIQQGEHTAIIGPNGSGKSSLIKLITCQHYPLAHNDGTPVVQVFGREYWNVFELRTQLGIVSADLHQSFVGGSSFADVTGFEAVLSGFFASQGILHHEDVTADMQHQAEQAVQQVDAVHLAAKPMEEMSTGEVRRILIARALVTDPPALLLDEPTTGLDIVTRQRFLQTIEQLATQGKTILLVTHHLEEIIPAVQRVILLQHGRIVGDGSKQQMLTDERLSALFGIPLLVHAQEGYFSVRLGTNS
ncbi:MAG: ATP-binding cassette domain-containing protein [Anaerolineae bacterium]|nr:ATP-binding cassette domain-containing protein [Anaerolineae bacterium]